ncbi:hypothetical protein RND81_10G114300 [Saponaria officinalis]|uniref:Uncharacterized protein n=1 Tax=Saponaria officinalis TaxID=3572 RepID=A0AAW1I1R6_SAPOF
MPSIPTVNTINNNSTMLNGQGQGWNTPVPYLFGGLGIMFCLIAIAFIILACSFSKSSSSSNISGNNIDEEASGKSSFECDNEPKIVVIMAGDHNPTYLAKPIPSRIIGFDYNRHIVN